MAYEHDEELAAEILGGLSFDPDSFQVFTLAASSKQRPCEEFDESGMIDRSAIILVTPAI